MEIFDQGAPDSCTLMYCYGLEKELMCRHSLYLKLRDD